MSSEAPTGSRPRPPSRSPPLYHQHHPGYGGTLLDHRLPAVEKYAFCLCLHVKPTTIFIAAFKMIDALLFISNLLNSELSFDEQASNVPNYNSTDAVHRSTVVAIGILTRSIIASASVVAIYAVMSARASLLMPLYSVLLIDFFFALPSFYGRDMDSPLASDGVIGMKHSHATDSDQLNRYEIFISTLSMITKIYCLCAIWKCYRYLRLIQMVDAMIARQQMIDQQTRSQQSRYGLLDIVSQTQYGITPNPGAAPPPYESITANEKAPPNYEEAVKPSSNVYTIDIGPERSQPPT